MDVNQGIGSNNERARVIKRWLEKAPERGVCVQLLTTGEDSLVCAEWLRDACVNNAMAVADEVEQLMITTAEDLELRELKFILVWCGEGNTAILTKPITWRRPVDILGADSAGDVAKQLDGSQSSMLRQMQRHTEAHARMYLTAHQALVYSLTNVVDKLSDRIVTSENNAERARNELANLREKFAEAVETAIDGSEPLSPAQERLLELGERLAPLLVAKFGGPSNSNGSAPAAA